jgi:multiple sugar transport system substrate-binding protein
MCRHRAGTGADATRQPRGLMTLLQEDSHMARRTLLVSLFMIVSLVLAACGPGADDDTDEGTPEPPAEDGAASPAEDGEASPAEDGEESPAEDGGAAAAGEIFVHGFSYEETDDIIARTRVEFFREQNPDVDVSFSEGGFDAPTFLTSLQSDDPPDIVRISRDIIGSYIARGVLQPLDDCIAQEGVDASIYREAAMQQVTSDGTIYALPDFQDTAVWMALNPVFEEAGLDATTFDWSDWDAIAEANGQLLQGQGADLERIGIDPKVAGDYSFFHLWVYANGGRLLSDDGLESLLDTPEVLEALEFTKGLIEAHGTVSEFLDFRGNVDLNGDFFGSPNQFQLESEAAFPQQQWYLNVLAENSPEVELTITPFVTRDEGEPITFQEGQGWAIVEGTDGAEAACTFITTMVSTDAWVAAAEARKAEREGEGLPFTGTYSGNREADEIIFGELVDLSDTPVFEQGVQAVLDSSENAYALPRSPAGEEFRQAVLDALDAAMTGTDPAEALQTADEEAQDAIDSAAP